MKAFVKTTRGGKVPNIKDNQSRLFMADDVKGIKRLRQKM